MHCRFLPLPFTAPIWVQKRPKNALVTHAASTGGRAMPCELCGFASEGDNSEAAEDAKVANVGGQDRRDIVVEIRGREQRVQQTLSPERMLAKPVEHCWRRVLARKDGNYLLGIPPALGALDRLIDAEEFLEATWIGDDINELCKNLGSDR